LGIVGTTCISGSWGRHMLLLRLGSVEHAKVLEQRQQVLHW
jgi:hypothetical protein